MIAAAVAPPLFMVFTSSIRALPGVLRDFPWRQALRDLRLRLRDDRLILERLAAQFGDRRIEDTGIPLHITATDFANGDLVEIDRGRLVDAIRASISLPFAFAPVKLDGRLLVDGYLADPLPVSVAMKHGARVIVAVGFESPYQENVRSAGRYAFQLSAIMSNNLLKSRFAFHSVAHHSEVIAILPEFKQRIRLFDTEKIPYIIDEGEQAARAQLAYLRRLLDEMQMQDGQGGA